MQTLYRGERDINATLVKFGPTFSLLSPSSRARAKAIVVFLHLNRRKPSFPTKCKQMERRGRVSRTVKSDPPNQVQQGNKLHGDICEQQACMAHSLPPHRLCVAGRLGSSYCTREVLCACVVPSWLPASSQSVVTHTQASIMRCVVWGAEQKDEP